MPDLLIYWTRNPGFNPKYVSLHVLVPGPNEIAESNLMLGQKFKTRDIRRGPSPVHVRPLIPMPDINKKEKKS